MTTNTKLLILELLEGIFGWRRLLVELGWFVAGASAIYFLAMAVGFEGSWTLLIVALVISGLSSWLAGGFLDHKKRVAFEADLVVKGLSPDEAREAWLKVY